MQRSGFPARARPRERRPQKDHQPRSPLSLFVDLYIMLFVLFFNLIINAYATTPASVVVESGGSVTVKAGGTLEIGSSAVPVKSPPSPPPTQVSSTASPPLTPPAAPTYKRLPNEAGNHGAWSYTHMQFRMLWPAQPVHNLCLAGSK